MEDRSVIDIKLVWSF